MIKMKRLSEAAKERARELIRRSRQYGEPLRYGPLDEVYWRGMEELEMDGEA